MNGLFGRSLVFGVVLFLVSCAQNPVQTTAQVCGVYSNTLISLSAYKQYMSDDEREMVNATISLFSPTCEGAIPEGEAGDLLTSSLDALEALLLKLKKEHG